MMRLRGYIAGYSDLEPRYWGPSIQIHFNSMDNLAIALNGRGQYAEAAEITRKSLELLKRYKAPSIHIRSPA